MAGRERFSPTPADRNKLVQLPPSADDLPERTVIDLNSKTPAIPIAIVDDTPEDDRGRPTELDYSLADQEDDLRDISERTKKRIDRLKFETHTERRAREAAERERDAAVQLANDQRNELERLRRGAETGAAALANSMKAEREAKLADAERRYAQAHVDGDGEAMAKATRDISTATAELTAIAARTPAPRTEQPQTQPAPQPQRQQAPNIAPNVVGWIAHNDRWFNKDPAKTKVALSFHDSIVARNIRPESAEYTRELDRLMQTAYPDHQPYEQSDGGDQSRRDAPRRTNGVAEGGRDDSMQQPRLREGQVELTQSEVSLAQRMRIPLDKYAEEKRKRMQREGNGA